MLDRAVESVGRAAATGLTVTFTPADTTRTDAAFFAKVTEAVHHAGAQRIVITDTAGCASPRGIGALVTLARTVAPIQIQVHCHNDFGLALAAVLAAVEAGATVVDTTVLGFGERAGNAALDEVAVALEALYDVKTGLDLTQLTGLAVVVAQQLGMAISPMKPLVGWNHVDIPTPLSADAVGNTQWV
jgi:2-isopropylmalate synthase